MVVHSVSVTQGFDRFSVPNIPVTTLQPGDSLDIPVTFNSVLNLASTGLLVIDSDINVLGGNVELQGTGQLDNLPAIHVDFYNNLQGAQVGVTNVADNDPITVTNQGSAPLTITQIRVAAGQGQDEYSIGPLSRAGCAPAGGIDQLYSTFHAEQSRFAARRF